MFWRKIVVFKKILRVHEINCCFGKLCNWDKIYQTFVDSHLMNFHSWNYMTFHFFSFSQRISNPLTKYINYFSMENIKKILLHSKIMLNLISYVNFICCMLFVWRDVNWVNFPRKHNNDYSEHVLVSLTNRINKINVHFPIQDVVIQRNIILLNVGQKKKKKKDSSFEYIIQWTIS